MKKYRFLAVFTALLITVCPLFGAAAQAASPVKEENVYARLNHNGSLESAYLVNVFYTSAEGTYTDYGPYTKVSSLSDPGNLSVNNGVVSFQAPAGRYAYQGDLGRVDLPWKIDITYMLNGQTVDGESLAGQSGRVTIRLRITQNRANNQGFFDNFALQTTLSFDAKKISNLSAPGATVANAGSKKTVAFNLLPGQTGDYTISFQAQDFEMDAIQFSGVPLSFDLDLDMSDLTSGLSALIGGIRTLSIYAAELSHGIGAFYTGIKTINTYLGGLSSGLTEAAQGYTGLFNALQEIHSGLTQLSAGFTAYLAGMDTAAAQLTTPLTQLADGVDLLKAAYAGYRTAVNNDPAVPENPNHPAYTTEYVQNLVQTDAALAAQLAAAAAQTADESTRALLLQAAQALGDSAGALGYSSALIDQTEKLLNGDVSASQPVPALGDSLRATANGITQAFAGLKMGGQTIQTNLAAISNGLSLLLNGDGTQQNPGFAGANAGLNMLASSLAAMQSSLSEALAEAAPLPGGAEQIAEGLNEMKNSTNGIEDQVNAQIDSILDGFSGSFDAPSFADARNKVSSVQFIFMTQAIRITKADDAPADIPEISEPAPKTAWDRLVDLFR